jgi:hypothetical protein
MPSTRAEKFNRKILEVRIEHFLSNYEMRLIREGGSGGVVGWVGRVTASIIFE